MMKKITILFVALFAIIASASAEKGKFGVGASLGYGTEIESLGISGRLQYGLTDKIRLAPDFTYFIKNNSLNMWDINLNGHYLIPIGEKLVVYPIAGILVSHWSIDMPKVEKLSNSDTDFGINLGGGVQYNFTERMFFNAEFKYGIVSNFDQAVISAGIGYTF